MYFHTQALNIDKFVNILVKNINWRTMTENRFIIHK